MAGKLSRVHYILYVFPWELSHDNQRLLTIHSAGVYKIYIQEQNQSGQFTQAAIPALQYVLLMLEITLYLIF